MVPGYNNLAVSVGTSQSVTGLVAGTSYSYRVRAVNAGGTSANSNTIVLVTAPLAPTANAGTGIGSSSFTANWGTVAGASSYRLDVSIDSFATYVRIYLNLAVSGTSQDVTGLNAGTPYSYQIRAVNSGGASPNSTAINVTTLDTIPPAPASPNANSAINITSSSFVANWSSASGATEYRVDVDTSNVFLSPLTNFNNRKVTGDTSLSVSGLAASTTYYYRVRAANEGGTSGNSNIDSVTTLVPPIAAPPGLQATSVGSTSFAAVWNTVGGATGYRLDVSEDNFVTFLSGYSDLNVFGDSTKLVSGLVPNTSYKFRVRAYDLTGSSINSAVANITTAPLPPIASDATGTSTTSFTANWSAATGATSYRLDVLTNNSTTYVANYQDSTVTDTLLLVTGLNPGTNYSYRVRAVNAGGTSANSNTISLLTIPAAPSAVAASGVFSTSFTARWTTVAGATTYRLDVATDNFPNYVSTYQDRLVSDTTQLVTGLTAGTTYTYRVRAVNAAGTSANSDTISVVTVAAAPSVVAASGVFSTSFTARWTAVTGATSYQLDVSTNTTFTSMVLGYNNLEVNVGASKSVSGLSAGTSYSYRVRAVNAAGTSANSNTISLLTVPAAPSAVAATIISSSGFTANWSTASGASSYRLDVSSDNFASNVTNYQDLTVGGTSQAVTGLSAGTNYSYRVSAVNTGGTGASSNPVVVVTIPEIPLASDGTVIGITNFTATWSPVNGATSYRLDVAVDNAFSLYVPGFQSLAVASTSHLVSGLIGNTKYYYRVRAVNQSGNSASSNLVSVTTVGSAPQSPRMSPATNISSTGFVANWIPSTNATSYLLDVSPDGFNSFVAGYQNLSVIGVAQIVTGLNPGIMYSLRARAVSAGGSSGYSDTVLVKTNGVPTVSTAAPYNVISAGATLAGTVVANGDTTTATFEYGVSTSYGSTAFASENPITGSRLTNVSRVVSGLASGTTYHYRAVGTNIVGVTNGLDQSFLTTPSAPVAASALQITSSRFTTSWNPVFGASGYRLDVALNNTFTTFVTGFRNLAVSDTTQPVQNLVPNTTYFYRVRALNATGAGLNSNAVSCKTMRVATTIRLSSGNQQSAVVLDSLSLPLVVTVTDETEAPVPNVAVVYSLDSIPSGASGQVLSKESTFTDVNGQAISILRLGNKIGVYRVGATSVGLSGSPITFTATALTGPVATVTPFGTNQSHAVGQALDSALVVILKDAYDNPVRNKPVSYVVSSAPSGSFPTLSDTLMLTDSMGRASSVLTLGDSAGTYVVTARIAGATDVVFTATGILIRGDANGDNTVDVADITRVIDHVSGRTLLTGVALKRADISGDGAVDQVDLDLMLSDLLAGNPPPGQSFPVAANAPQQKNVKTVASAPGLRGKFEITPAGLRFSLVNNVPVRAVQVYMKTRNRTDLGITDVSFPRTKDHVVRSNFVGTEIRSIIYSLSNAEITPDSTTLFRLPFTTTLADIDSLRGFVSLGTTNQSVQLTMEAAGEALILYPQTFALSQNFPNPFNPTTKIQFQVPDVPGKFLYTALTVFNLLGQKVKTLFRGELPAGTYTLIWDGTDETLSRVPSGIYFYRLASGDIQTVRSMLLIK
jgi:phosphodiesterase/alkaline phosphatase D-like protein